MADQVTRNNHYVPQWYQRGFIEYGQSQLHYLDMSPPQKVLSDGRTVPMNALHKWGPKSCFAEAVQGSSAASRADQFSLQFIEAAQGMQREWADVASTLRLVGHVELSVPLAGFERNDVRRLLLTFGRVKSVRPVPFAMLIKLDASAVGSG